MANSREQALIRALVDLGDTLVCDYDLLEFLYTLSERCTDLLAAAASGLLVERQSGTLDIVAASSNEMRALEFRELQSRQGPSVDAYLTGEAVNVDDLGKMHRRWPEFVSASMAAGYRSATGQPLRVREQQIGALNVFWDTPSAFSQDDLAVARGLADMAAVGITNHRLMATAEERVRDLERALESGAAIEQAKAVLAERTGMDTGDAFDRIRRYSRSRNERLHDIARRFLDGDLETEVFGQDAAKDSRWA